MPLTSSAFSRAILHGVSKLRPAIRRWSPPAWHDFMGRTFRAALRRSERHAEMADGWRVPTSVPWRADPHANGLVLHVNDALAAGGAERQLVNLLLATKSRLPVAPQLVCLRLGERPDLDFFLQRLQAEGIEVRNAPSPQSATAWLAQRMPTLLPVTDAQYAWLPRDVRDEMVRLLAVFLDKRPAVVHAWQDSTGIAAALAALLAGVPRVLVSTRNVSPRHFGYFRPYMLPAYRALAREARVTFINNSHAGARDYQAWLGSDVPFEVVHNGTTLADAAITAEQKSEARRALGWLPDTAVVGGVFRLNEEKRPLLWLKVAKFVLEAQPSARFVLYGSGPMAGKIDAEIKRLGLSRHMQRRSEVKSITAALSSMDVLLLCSAQEGTPNVVLEAGLCGLPAVIVDTGGASETIEDGKTGYVVADTPVEQHLVRALGDRVVQVLADAEWREQARIHGPEFVKRNFSIDRMVNATIAAYTDHTVR